MKVISCGWVSTTHNPLRAAEYIAALDNMLRGRFSFGLVRGYQARWVENFKIRPELAAVGPWNKDTAEDDLNREYFTEYVEVVLKALRSETFSHRGRFWQFPPEDFRNPHRHDVYTRYGAGVREDMAIDEVGIAPRPFQQPMPQLYGGFTGSMRTSLFWARHLGRPIVLSDNLPFCKVLWSKYKDEAAKHGHDVAEGDQAAWGGILLCAPTDAEAQEWITDMRWLWDSWSVPFGQATPMLLVGSPDTITRQIEAATEQFAVNDLFGIIPQGILDPERNLTSLELIASKVMPRFA
jgi:alkanesulfonate monooxygenase SsuD/methylene tetrahydromethanopterin reductase-like flavin-dependent oxidoreductase (luciferase family)